MNKGKIFETDFKKSIPEDLDCLFYYRFKDGTANWQGEKNQNVRFQQHNIADCMIFYKDKLFILELKAHSGKSMPFSCMHGSQYEEMCSASIKKNVIPMVIIFFYDLGECYAISINDFKAFKEANTRKSINLMYLREKGFKIDCRALKVHTRYDIVKFLEEARQNK